MIESPSGVGCRAAGKRGAVARRVRVDVDDHFGSLCDRPKVDLEHTVLIVNIAESSAGLEHLAARVLACYLVLGGVYDVGQVVGGNDDDAVVVTEDDVSRVDDDPADLDW